MKIVVIGATGNVGTSVLGALGQAPNITEIVGVARRQPEIQLPKVTWATADVSSDRLDPLLSGADAVIHLAWVLQPSHQPHVMERINVDGSKRVFDAVGRLGVQKLVVASSVAAYSPAQDQKPVDENYPTGGIATSRYSTQKAAIERALDTFESNHPSTSVVRLRTHLIFKADAASEIHRYFLGPLVPARLFRLPSLPRLPIPARIRLQPMHSSDVAEAYLLAATTDVSGAFNIAGEPTLTPDDIAELFGTKAIDFPKTLLRGLVDVTWKLHLQRTELGWIDMALQSPTLDTSRAREVLRWKPTVDAGHALRELVEGFANTKSWTTPPLSK